MFHDERNNRLLSDLGALQKALRDTFGTQLISKRVDDAVGDFEHQPTVWDAYDGRNRSQGWELPSDFATMFEAWSAAYRRLADVSPQDPAGLDAVLVAVEAASDTLLAELYRCKDARVGRLILALDLFAASEEIVRQNLRRKHPGAPPELIDRYLDEWIHERPGAESGDAGSGP